MENLINQRIAIETALTSKGRSRRSARKLHKLYLSTLNRIAQKIGFSTWRAYVRE